MRAARHTHSSGVQDHAQGFRGLSNRMSIAKHTHSTRVKKTKMCPTGTYHPYCYLLQFQLPQTPGVVILLTASLVPHRTPKRVALGARNSLWACSLSPSTWPSRGWRMGWCSLHACAFGGVTGDGIYIGCTDAMPQTSLTPGPGHTGPSVLRLSDGLCQHEAICKIDVRRDTALMLK